MSNNLKSIVQSPTKLSAVEGIGLIVLICSVLCLACIPQQSDFLHIITFSTIAFTAYWVVTFWKPVRLKWVLGAGIVIRCLLLTTFPNLSDDIYRFVWDGQLIQSGINPYGYLPSDIIVNQSNTYWHFLYDEMNSPNYYTIYPPLTQLLFYISTWAGENIGYSNLILKLFFFIAEIATFLGLVRILDFLKKDKKLVSIYFLNPLILAEGMGNLHFEIIMISFLVWSIYYIFCKKNILIGSLFMTLSIASKLLPLMFLPFFLFKLKGASRIKFFSIGLVSMIVAFSPIILGLDFGNFGSSIDLYFQKFEFNAGIYYAMRFFGEQISGYNLIRYIGPFLGIAAVILITRKAYNSINTLQNYMHFAFFSFCCYLLLATTVHPWYLATPIVLSVFVRYRFAVVWSFLIMLSYINYSYDPYFENLWVVALEYILIGSFLLYESKNRLVETVSY